MIKNLVDSLLKGKGIPDEHKRKIAERTDLAINNELINKPPVIALIGISGVGKSSTINALFGTDLPISHFKACTQKEEEILVKGKNGDIIIYDMPGLGEDIIQDEIHKKTYESVLPKCDVVLWILAAKSRGSMSFEQLILRDFISVVSAGILDRLVIGVNQVDLIDPNDWIEEGNIPSKEQKQNIELRIEDVRTKLGRVIPNLSMDRILYYSATKNYRLVNLFGAMLDAAKKRGWVLDSRKAIADYRKRIKPEIIKAIKNKRR